MMLERIEFCHIYKLCSLINVWLCVIKVRFVIPLVCILVVFQSDARADEHTRMLNTNFASHHFGAEFRDYPSPGILHLRVTLKQVSTRWPNEIYGVISERNLQINLHHLKCVRVVYVKCLSYVLYHNKYLLRTASQMRST